MDLTVAGAVFVAGKAHEDFYTWLKNGRIDLEYNGLKVGVGKAPEVIISVGDVASRLSSGMAGIRALNLAY